MRKAARRSLLRRKDSFDRRPASAVRRLLAAALVWLSLPWTAQAQEPEPGGPYRGLFKDEMPAETSPGPQAPRRFSYSVQAFEQAALGGARSSGNPWQSSYSGLDLVLTGTRPGKRLSSGISGGTQLRAYHDARGGDIGQLWLTFDIGATLGKRTGLTVTGRAAGASTYSPSSPLASAVEDGAPAEQAGAMELSALRNSSVQSTVRLLRRVGKRTDTEAAYSAGVVAYPGRNTTVTTSRASAGVRRVLRRGLRLDLAYEGARVSSSRAGERLESDTHELRVATRYSPASMVSTSFVFAAIPTLARRQASEAGLSGDAVSGGTFTARLGVLASVDHRFSARAGVNLAFQRALYSDAGYVQPSFVQTVGGRLDMSLSKRLTASALTAYSTGLSTIALPGAVLDRFDAGVRLSFSVSLRAALAAEYRQSTYDQRGPTAPLSSGAYPGGRTVRVALVIPARSR